MSAAQSRSGHLPSTSDRSRSPTARHGSARPTPSRAETDRILSYYQSADADSSPLDHLVPEDGDHEYKGAASSSSTRPRLVRSPSTSSSEYSPQEESTVKLIAKKKKSTKAPTSTHRRNTPSEGGSDRRRLHIVQMGQNSSRDARSEAGSVQHESSSNSEGLRSRRGVDSGLALVAPPDASPKTYSYLTPPLSTATNSRPKSLSGTTPERDVSADDTRSAHHHHRSASEAVSSAATVGHKPPREIGVVGTSGLGAPSDSLPQLTPNSQLQPPLFQIPQSRSPSPGAASHDSHSESSRGRQLLPLVGQSQPILTPEIGQSKQIDDPVAAPVTVNLSNTQMDQLASSRTRSNSRGLASTSSTAPSQNPYLHYEPGVHSTAGPLPPPPRALFNIDSTSPPPPRPPRLHSPNPSHTGTRRRGDTEPVKQALQFPPTYKNAIPEKPSLSSLASVNSSKAGSEKMERSRSADRRDFRSESGADSPSGEPVSTAKHTREGAFPPSTLYTKHLALSPTQSTSVTPPIAIPNATPRASNIAHPHKEMSMDELMADVTDAIDEVGIMRGQDVPPPNIIEPPREDEVDERPALDIRRQESWVSQRSEVMSRSSSDDGGRLSVDSEGSLGRVTSASPPSSYHEKDGVSTSLTRKHSTRDALLKRFSSLPRTPSVKSSNRLSSSTRSAQTPSPPIVPPSIVTPPHRQVQREKIRTAWPAAMSCSDVLAKRSSADRSRAYAEKINELWMCDCGLGDWVAETRYRAANPHRASKNARLGPPASKPMRHVSRSSMASEATFPRRPDAYAATDLSSHPSEDSVPTSAPPLPYPSLATAPPPQPSRSSTLGTPLVGSRLTIQPLNAKSGGGFFASLGRKTSVVRKTGPTSPTTSSSSERRVLTKQPPTEPAPRPVNISSAPSVPGGPRAPPNRMLRSQTIMISPFQSNAATGNHRNTSMVRRPSMFGAANSDPVINIERDPEFTRQVDKLADLLPQADRSVLAGYLRRAGQDILAIGQYLEDEKNGTIRVN
ncbi:hypothetical protein PLICRDRAFT_693960 [Plicaturopsis crispa FD-325 SS-3]|nr:hypothetical protein PLICRDRAFT_693960 [Plicaturopsis crispa FD-325 SS-3]